jgi:hypothetical protein
MGPPDPEMRRAALAGSPNRKPEGLSSPQNEYADRALVSSVLVAGAVFSFRTVAPNGLIIGHYGSRPEAALAMSEVQS